MADVFISYKRDQRPRVQQIADLLKAEQISVWFDASLETGRGEGFDAEIEREVSSAYCVLACWTPAAVSSVYVRAESKKGLERNVLLPVMLQPCSLPVPFNDVDFIDLTGWKGAKEDAAWTRLLTDVKNKVDKGKRDHKALIEQARAAYERVDDKIYPGILALLSRRIAALHELDASQYQNDVDALLDWMQSIAEKEHGYVESGWERACRQDGGDAWRFWDSGAASARADEIAAMRSRLVQLQRVLGESEELLRRQAP